MRILFWSFVTFAGALGGLGELAYVKYFAGETIGNAVLFDAGKPLVHQIDIAESDLPVRLNLLLYGDREIQEITFRSRVTLVTGGTTDCDRIEFEAAIDEDGDLGDAALGSGNLKLRLGDVPNKAQSSQLFSCPTVGTWALSALVYEESNFKMRRIEAVIKRNSRATNWLVAGPGLAVLLVGFVMLVASLRKKRPHLAS